MHGRFSVHTHKAVQMIFICYADPFSIRPTTYWLPKETCFSFMAVGYVVGGGCWVVLLIQSLTIIVWELTDCWMILKNIYDNSAIFKLIYLFILVIAHSMWNLLEQRSNPCPLRWQADSYPLYLQRSPCYFN